MGIGFIGLGIMGSRMAARLARLTVEPLMLWNRSTRPPGAYTRGDPASPAAAWGESPADVAAAADLLFVMVGTPAAAVDVVEGEGGVLAGLRRRGPAPVVVNTTTIDPDTARRLGEQVHAHGGRYLDAPVLGSRDAAADGQLRFLVGGDAAILALCAQPLRVLGRDVTHVGPVGSGSAVKLVCSALLGSGMAAAAEALTLGDRLGVSRQFILDQVLGLPVVAPAVAGKRELIAAGARDAHFPLKWMLKDLRLATHAAGEARLPVIEEAARHYEAAVRAGRGDHDHSAVAAC